MRWLLLCLFSLTTCAVAAPPKDLVRVQLLADVKSIKPGSDFRLAVDFTITPGWHIYWLNPGDGGLPTKAVLDLPKGLKADPIQFPVPKTFNLDGGLTAYGYEDHATLLTMVHVADNYKATETKIGCDAIWLVCKDICVAGKASPSLSLPLGDGEADHEREFKQAADRLPRSSTHSNGIASTTGRITLDPNGRSGVLSLKIKWRNGLPAQIAFFPPPTDSLTFAKPALTPADNQTTIETTFDVLAGQKLPAGPIDSVLSFQPADNTTGVFPQNAPTVGVTVPIHFESAMPAAH